MKITNIRGANNPYNNLRKNKVKSNDFSSYMKQGSVEISQRGKEFSYAIEKLNSLPEIRKEKVENIKNQIKNGTYRVDAGNIARAILLGEINA